MNRSASPNRFSTRLSMPLNNVCIVFHERFIWATVYSLSYTLELAWSLLIQLPNWTMNILKSGNVIVNYSRGWLWSCYWSHGMRQTVNWKEEEVGMRLLGFAPVPKSHCRDWEIKVIVQLEECEPGFRKIWAYALIGVWNKAHEQYKCILMYFVICPRKD